MKSALCALFGRRLKEALKASGLRQNELARETKLTGSAVSQIVNGVFVPSRQTLDKMLELIGDSEYADHLAALWQRIRLGEKDALSPVNREIRNGRRRRRISVVQLANLSGISAERIRQLESGFDLFPTEEEIRSLVAVLPCKPERLRPKPAREEILYSNAPTPYLAAAEGPLDLPLIPGERLKEYRPPESFAVFAASAATSVTPCIHPATGAVAAAFFDAKTLGVGADGSLLVLLGEENLEKKPDFYLIAKAKRFMLNNEDFAGRQKGVLWKLPAVEIVFMPSRPEF